MTEITIVSGFLGAGKTTFCSRLLSYFLAKGEKTVYLVNEFGSRGLDGEIIEKDGFQAFELEGGCVCCTLKDNFQITLRHILDAYRPDRIVFEPSGIFVFDNFSELFKDDYMSKNCTVGSVITIVDGKNFHKYPLIAGSFVYNQIKNAPVLVLSKLSGDSKQCEELICDLKNINPAALIFAKDWRELTDHDFETLNNYDKGLTKTEVNGSHARLDSVTVELPFLLTEKMLFYIRKQVKSGLLGEIFRVKGFVKTEKGSLLFNMVLDNLTLTPCSEAEEYRLTFIGSKLQKKRILTLFSINN